MVKYEHYPTDLEPADIVAEYKYDIYGRRLQKNVNGVITNFFWERDNMSFELNASYQPIRRYIYENGMDDVHGHVEYAEVDDPQYFSPEHKGWYSYIKDQVGTILKVYKHETKQMINTRTYDTFGNLVSQTGSSTGNLGYQSKYYDQESGLNYFYHRYYYPSIGRFINEDPIKFDGGKNFFLFQSSNPINFIDPFGLKCELKKIVPIFSFNWTTKTQPENIAKRFLGGSDSGPTMPEGGGAIGAIMAGIINLRCDYEVEQRIRRITKKHTLYLLAYVCDCGVKFKSVWGSEKVKESVEYKFDKCSFEVWVGIVIPLRKLDCDYYFEQYCGALK